MTRPQDVGNIVTCDLGFAQDYTAISVISRTEHLTGLTRRRWEIEAYVLEEEWKNHYELRWLERPPLKTSYPAIVDRLAMLMEHEDLKGNSTLVVDATGVGRPVVQMMQERGLHPVPVVVVGGTKESIDDDDGTFRVPKKIIVSSLQVLFQQRRLKVSKSLPLVPAFLKELDNFKMKKNIDTGNTSYEAWRASEHDDLVFAVGLGAWYGETRLSSKWKLKRLSAQDPLAMRLMRESQERQIEERLDEEASEGAKILQFRRW